MTSCPWINGSVWERKLLCFAILFVFFTGSFVFMLLNQEAVAPEWTVGSKWWRMTFPVSWSSGSYNETSSVPQTCESIFERAFGSLVLAYRRCLLDKAEGESKWTGLHDAVNACMGVLWRFLDVRFLYNQDDVKLVILPPGIGTRRSLLDNGPGGPTSFDCIEVTLGIGDDIDSERKLRDLAPSCRFHGADPIFASGKVFKELGRYYELAVGHKTGDLTANVLINYQYIDKVVPTVSFLDLLKSYARVDHVDYVFMDNEGSEYGLLQQFLEGGVLDTSNISICQMSVELHGPLRLYQMDHRKYDDLVTGLINNSAFVPFWSAKPINHVRTFYVNVRDAYCLDTYFKSRFCGKEYGVPMS